MGLKDDAAKALAYIKEHLGDITPDMLLTAASEAVVHTNATRQSESRLEKKIDDLRADLDITKKHVHVIANETALEIRGINNKLDRLPDYAKTKKDVYTYPEYSDTRKCDCEACSPQGDGFKSMAIFGVTFITLVSLFAMQYSILLFPGVCILRILPILAAPLSAMVCIISGGWTLSDKDRGGIACWILGAWIVNMIIISLIFSSHIVEYPASAV